MTVPLNVRIDRFHVLILVVIDTNHSAIYFSFFFGWGCLRPLLPPPASPPCFRGTSGQALAGRGRNGQGIV